MSEFENMTTPPPAPSGDAPQEERTLALVAHLLGIISWFVGPLIIWLISKDNPAKSFVTDQSREALNFQITITIAFVLAFILMTITLGLLFFLPPLVGVANLVFCIIGGIKANNGEAYRYPFALRLIK
ncbi:MAG: DUF4870 domain-containing protein [Lysobacteraceae bacterium]|nr:MAG: DUF4870 domain-containing protein [Xanthomonadaceae bacterium]